MLLLQQQINVWMFTTSKPESTWFSSLFILLKIKSKRKRPSKPEAPHSTAARSRQHQKAAGIRVANTNTPADVPALKFGRAYHASDHDPSARQIATVTQSLAAAMSHCPISVRFKGDHFALGETPQPCLDPPISELHDVQIRMLSWKGVLAQRACAL